MYVFYGFASRARFQGFMFYGVRHFSFWENFFTKGIITWQVISGYGTSCAWGDRKVVEGVREMARDGGECALG